MNYHHLSIEERSRIRKYYVNGHSYREIARLIGRNVSTVSRELRRKGKSHGKAETRGKYNIAMKIPDRRAETMENALVSAVSIPFLVGQDHYL